MSARIDGRAVVDGKAKLGEGVVVGPYSIIEAGVEIGDHSEIGSHVVIKSGAKIGRHNKIFQFASIGEEPQDLKYKGEKTRLEIGDHNIIREYCTLNRGTQGGGGLTKIGDHNLIMAYTHIAHDCILKNRIIIATHVAVAGHVTIDDHAIFGGFVGVHQFCHIGAHSFSAAASMIPKDVLPFTRVSGYYAKPFGVNVIGLQRSGFSEQTIAQIKQAYRIIYRKNLTAKEALEQLRSMSDGDPEVQRMVEAMARSERGFVR